MLRACVCMYVCTYVCVCARAAYVCVCLIRGFAVAAVTVAGLSRLVIRCDRCDLR